MRNTLNILGVDIDNITMDQAVEKIKSFIYEDRVHTIYTPNAEIVMDAKNNADFRNILNQSDMLVADGAGVVLASRILGRSVPEKVSGIDLVKRSFEIKLDRKIKYFFFGSKPGVADEAAVNLLKTYPGIEVVGCRNGYFSEEDVPNIIEQINASGADILLVALGAPKQENWIHSNKQRLKVKVCIGVGGSLNIFAGRTMPTPEFMRRNGLEWLHRLYKEPWRFKRMLKLPKFILTAIFTRIGLLK